MSVRRFSYNLTHYSLAIATLCYTVMGLSIDNTRSVFIGFDFGTSGARVSVIEEDVTSTSAAACHNFVEVHSDSTTWKDVEAASDSNEWIEVLNLLLGRVPSDIRARCRAICASGTSASCVLVDRSTGEATRGGQARMYNFDVISSDSLSTEFGRRAIAKLEEFAPENHTAKARTSSLAKLLTWNEESSLLDNNERLAHQADFIMSYLTTAGEKSGSYDVVSDWHNSLKLGFDVRNREWPSWLNHCLDDCGIPSELVLPSKVVSPGTSVASISPSLSSTFCIPSDAQIVAPTTDSNAAFFAAAGTKPSFGTAVTSLGSTLAMKVLSKSFCEDSSLGVYSHRFPLFTDNSDERSEAWLVGGASNSGCAVLRQLNFSNEELIRLSAKIDPNVDSSLHYYPLIKKGERFPVADSDKEPILHPIPADRKDFLHGLLQGIAEIEIKGFAVLGDLGMEPELPGLVLTCGGGSKNEIWQQLRERKLSTLAGQKICVRRANNTEASFGAAILASATFV